MSKMGLTCFVEVGIRILHLLVRKPTSLNHIAPKTVHIHVKGPLLCSVAKLVKRLEIQPCQSPKCVLAGLVQSKELYLLTSPRVERVTSKISV